MEGLPKLPGYQIPIGTRQKHFIPRVFTYENGVPVQKPASVGVGGEPLDNQGVLYHKVVTPLRYDPTLTYGRSSSKVATSVFKPHFVTYDRKCLKFSGFFKQSVFESPAETYRIRKVNIIYFLENDSITVMEPATPNAGFPQGRLVSRKKIDKPGAGRPWHWKDLNVGMVVAFYGVSYYICSCDSWTREYLISQGVEVNQDEDIPDDPYLERRATNNARPQIKPRSVFDDKRYRSQEYQGKVLRFFVLRDDQIGELSETGPYRIHYFLEDDTVEVAEEKSNMDGKDRFALLVKKIKVPKSWDKRVVEFPRGTMETREDDIDQFLSPTDFIVGNTVFIFRKKFLIIDCDAFTRKYYSDTLGIEQPPPIPPTAQKAKVEPLKQVFPTDTGYGIPEDSIQSMLTYRPGDIVKDAVRELTLMSKKLRYTASLQSTHPEDVGRSFIITYRLSDCTVMVYEQISRNSGFSGGKFLRPTLLPKEGSNPDNPEYYSPLDFRLGKRITIFGRRFVITGLDLAVYRYMKANPEKFPPEQIDEAKAFLMNEGYLNQDIRDIAEFRKREEISDVQDITGNNLVEPVHTASQDQPVVCRIKKPDQEQPTVESK